jgi:hypothetical protein
MAKAHPRKQTINLTANVLLEFSIYEATSEEVLDAYCDEVLEAIEANVADIALGPAMTLNPHDSVIKLRFDVLGKTQDELYERVARAMRTITEHTGLELQADRSRMSAHPADDDVAQDSEFAAA